MNVTRVRDRSSTRRHLSSPVVTCRRWSLADRVLSLRCGGLSCCNLVALVIAEYCYCYSRYIRDCYFVLYCTTVVTMNAAWLLLVASVLSTAVLAVDHKEDDIFIGKTSLCKCCYRTAWLRSEHNNYSKVRFQWTSTSRLKRNVSGSC